MKKEAYPDYALKPGTLLRGGAYEVHKYLSRGITGISYKGWDKRLNRPILIKELFPAETTRQGQQVIFPQEVSAEELREKFLQELRILSQIEHKSVIRVYDYVEDNGTVYGIMEFLSEGKPLSEIIKARRRLSEKEGLRYLWDILYGLNEIHKKGILHRHIMPAHIYVQEHRAVLIEFGMARFFIANRTQTYTQVLDQAFAPFKPLEQWDVRARLSPAADLYSVGATFYYAFTGEMPPDAMGRALEARTTGDPLKPLHLLRPDLSPSLAHAIMKCLELSAGRRFSSVREMMERIPPRSP